jgi:hypothetical protein
MKALAREGGVNQMTQAADRYCGIVPTMVYASLLQAGVDRVELSSGFQFGALPQFGGRVKVIGIDAWAKANNRISTAFQNVPPKIHELENLSLLFLFLTELMNALDTRCHVGWTDRVPTSELCDELLPTMLAIPIGHLLSTLRVVEPFVVMPRLQLERTDVVLLDEILASDAFRNYVSAHSLLDNADIPVHDAVAAVSESANTLVALDTALLKYQRTTAHVVQITAKLVSLLGSVSGVLAEALANALTEALNERRRIVIYDLRLILGRIYLSLLRERRDPN